MKIILSRKGFDSQSGGMPNPILPDGTLLVFPIPDENGSCTYHDISYGGKSYYEIMKELNPHVAEKLVESRCHLDPDIFDCRQNSTAEWKPSFGQCGMSQRHLEKEHVNKGDLFLFYSWFRHTEEKDGKLRFIGRKDSQTYDKHIIYGYLEIERKIVESTKIEKEFFYHPHANNYYITKPNNVLYLPSKHLLGDENKKGCGVLAYSPIRQLTKECHLRSEWELPDCFRDIRITYHEKASYGWIDGKDYFKTASRGQEFVLEANEEILQWVKEVLVG